MKTLSLYILLFVISFTSFSQKTKELRPILKKQSVSILSGRHNVYHLSNKTVYQVAGYKQLIVYSRERVNKKGLGYTISYQFNNQKAVQYIVSKKNRDYKSAYLDKNIHRNPSLFYKKEIHIPKGAKFITFKTKNNPLVDLKVAISKNRKNSYLKPQKATKAVLITGKTRNYYKLNSKTPTIIETNQEGKLIVYTRKRMSSKSSNHYSFSYTINDSITKKINIKNVKKSSHSVYRSLGIKQTPSTYNKTVIQTDNVYQKITFSSKQSIDARFVFKKTIQKNGWEEIETKKGKIVPLVVNKKKIIKEYTRIDHNNSFDFDISNTDEIKIFIRGEFQYDMHANNDYVIVLKDNGKILNTYRLSSNRSNVMHYKYNDELIPGTLDKFSIKVPLGKHKYSISILNKNKTALIRVLKKIDNTQISHNNLN